MTGSGTPGPLASALLVLRLARRELRSGLRGFRIFLACLTLGVGAIAAVGTFSSALKGGLERDGQAILGGDVELALVHQQMDPAQQAFVASKARVSEIATLRAMSRPLEGDRRALVEIKAVDDAYPLFGSVTLAGGGALAAALDERNGIRGVAVEDTLLARLDLEVGDRIRIGDLEAEIRDVIAREPDRVASGLVIGPRVMMTREALTASGLVRPGSLVTWRYRLRLPNGSQPALAAFSAGLEEAFPDAGWRIRDRSNGAPGMLRFIDRLTLFLTLVGLTSLIIGGVGVGNGVRSYLDTKRDVIATLKCLGASGRLVFRIYLVQVLILAAFAVAFGIGLGALVPALIGLAVEDLLPIPLRFGIYWQPLLLASAFGFLTTLAFALWPLGRAREVPASALFRDLVSPVRRWPRPVYVAGIAATLVALAVLAVVLSDDRRLTLWYVAGAGGSFVLLWLIAQGLMALAARLPRLPRPELRLGIANLYRPGAPTPSVVLSLGLGLTLLVALAQIDANLSRELGARIPDRSPSFFFVDIQQEQASAFERILSETPGVVKVERVPMLRGRIVALKGVPVEQVSAAPNAQWVIRGGRNMTYADELPENSELVRGTWWAKGYQGPPLVSIVDDIADGLGVTIGDEMTINVLGRDITARIANTRSVEWDSLQINFVLVLSANALAAAPHTNLATVTMDSAGELDLLRRVSDALPNVTAVRIKEILDAVNGLMGKLLLAVRGASGLTLLAGALVLAGAMAAGHRARLYDAVVLKAIGATRGGLMASYGFEYAILGATTAVFAAFAGTLGSYFVVSYTMTLDWVFAPAATMWTVAVATVATVVLGLAGTWRVLGEKAAPVLRSRS